MLRRGGPGGCGARGLCGIPCTFSGTEWVLWARVGGVGEGFHPSRGARMAARPRASGLHLRESKVQRRALLQKFIQAPAPTDHMIITANDFFFLPWGRVLLSLAVLVQAIRLGLGWTTVHDVVRAAGIAIVVYGILAYWARCPRPPPTPSELGSSRGDPQSPKAGGGCAVPGAAESHHRPLSALQSAQRRGLCGGGRRDVGADHRGDPPPYPCALRRRHYAALIRFSGDAEQDGAPGDC